MNYLVVTTKSWNYDFFEKIKAEDVKNQWFLITDKNELTLERVRTINPRYIFFPHWSWIIPKELYKNFECVVFHMTDLPYGRGGSPLQNLVVRGHTSTVLTALRVDEGLDTGDVYTKRAVSLEGKAEEIYKRVSALSFTIMRELVAHPLVPVPQSGEVVEFKRRKPEDGTIAHCQDLQSVYDYIRMLDAEGYPRAFLETDTFRLEFDTAEYHNQEIIARVKIIKKNI